MKRYFYLSASCAAVIGLVATSAMPRRPHVIWNASASVPIGLYAVHRQSGYHVGDLVAALPPEGVAHVLARGGYLPAGLPLIKYVAATAGQRVCRSGVHIRVDGRIIGDALAHDRRGRALPVWQGCRRLSAGQTFLMNARRRDSLDGRYFGAFARTTLLGRLTPILTDDGGHGHFTWHGLARANPLCSNHEGSIS